jgi:hypothetical protein
VGAREDGSPPMTQRVESVVCIRIRAQALARSFYKSGSQGYTLPLYPRHDLAPNSVMNPIIRAMRANIAKRDNWAQVRVGACALLLPPLTLGAAFYSMLAAPDEGAARPPGAAVEAQVVKPELSRDATPAQAVSADPQPVAQASEPIAVADKPARGSRVSASAAGIRRQPAASSAEETARVDSAPVQVAAAPPAGVTPPPPGEMAGPPRGALAPEPSWSAPVEVSTALLPRALIPPGKAPPQMPSPRIAAQTSAAQEPSAVEPPFAESSPAPPSAARKHARSETAAVHRNAQRRQHEFSLKDWLQQIGILPHNTRG